MTEELIQKLQSFGALGYSAEKIASIEGLNDAQTADLKTRLSTHGTKEQQAYQRGSDTAEYQLDMVVYELALQGDMKALSEYSSRKDRRIKEQQKQNRAK
jgi:hypothetical protein